LPPKRKDKSYQRRRKGRRGKETREKIRNKRKGTIRNLKNKNKNPYGF
jgi:hypothetical protein